MDRKKKGGLGAVGTLIVAIITITGTGSYDFSQDNSTTINDNSVNDNSETSTTNNFLDSITNNLANAPRDLIEDVVKDVAVDEICKLDPVPDNYAERCASR